LRNTPADSLPWPKGSTSGVRRLALPNVTPTSCLQGCCTVDACLIIEHPAQFGGISPRHLHLVYQMPIACLRLFAV